MTDSTSAARRPRKTTADEDPTAATYDAAWEVTPPAGDAWTARPWVHPTERAAAGKAARKRVPRAQPRRVRTAAGSRPDRHPRRAGGRSAAGSRAAAPRSAWPSHPSPTTGARRPCMAFDLADHAAHGHHRAGQRRRPPLELRPLRVPGADARLRRQRLRRDAARTLGVGRQAAGREHRHRRAGQRLQRGPEPRRHDGDGALLPPVDGPLRRHGPPRRVVLVDHRGGHPCGGRGEWPAAGRVGAAPARRLEAIFIQGPRRTALRAFEALTTVVDGRRVILDDPPVVTHVEIRAARTRCASVFEDYRATMPESRRDFLERYRFVDFALKVVGVGSVATRCFVSSSRVATRTIRSSSRPRRRPRRSSSRTSAQRVTTNHGERVVVGQQLMQATPDIFLGWTRGPGGRDYYIRQLWDMKGSVDTTTLLAARPRLLRRLCGWALARAHARSGDAVAISAYLGTGDTFDGAIADFAETYADQNARDHTAYVAAIKAGQVSVPAAG